MKPTNPRSSSLSGGVEHALLALPALISFLAWFKVTRLNFLSDDFIMVFFADNASWRDCLANFVHFKGGIFCRPVAHLVWTLDAWCWGLWPAGFHFTNLFFHSVNSCLTAVFARQVSGRLVVGVASGVLFAVYPLSVEAVAWVSGRYDLICVSFFLISLIAFMRAKSAPENPGWRLVSPFAYALALLSKESALALPAVALALELATPSSSREKYPIHLAYWSITILYLIYRVLGLGGWGLEGYEFGRFSPTYIASSMLVTALAPFNMQVFSTAPALLFLIFMIVAIATAAVRAGPKNIFSIKQLPAAALVIVPLLMLIHVLPVTPDLRESRFVYLPTAGFALFAGSILFPPQKSSLFGAAVAAIMTAAFFFGAAANLRPYQTSSRAVDKIVLQTASLARDLPQGAKLYLLDVPDNLDGAYVFRNGITFALALANGARVEGAGFHASVPQLESALPVTAWRVNDGGDAGISLAARALCRPGSVEGMVLAWRPASETIDRLCDNSRNQGQVRYRPDR